MLSVHFINIAIHVVAGSIGLLIGFVLLGRAKGTSFHRRWGRRFSLATLVVCLTAAIGSTFFRFIPLFAVLNVVVCYQLISGWRVIYTKENGPELFDGIWTLIGLAATVALVPVLIHQPGDTAPVILYSTLGALALLLMYDSARWIFPKKWHRTVWLYEHMYKIISALFAMLSAMVGNVVRFGQPWSQILPTVAGAFVIAWFFGTRIRQSRKTISAPETSG